MNNESPAALLPGKVAFTEAYRAWLLKQAVGEGASNFGRLRAVSSDLRPYLRDLCENWNAEQRISLLTGRIKRTKWRYLAPADLSAEEETAYEQFEWPILTFRSIGPTQPWRTSAGFEGEIDRSKVGVAVLREQHLQGKFKVSKPALKKYIGDVLRPVLGRPRRDPGSWRYMTEFGGVTLCTDIDFNSRLAQLRYAHWLVSGRDAADVGCISERVLLRPMSLFNLVGGGDTRWEYMTDRDIPDAAALLVRLCTDFLAAVPHILDGARRAQERLDKEAVDSS